MKKEILIAIAIGFILGLIITFGIWTANKSLQENSKNQKTENIPTESANNSQPVNKEGISLLISTPENNALIDQEKIKITGKTAKQATVVFLFEEGEAITEADDNGEFSQEITLNGGANEINITAFDQKGNEANKILNLVYSTAEI